MHKGLQAPRTISMLLVCVIRSGGWLKRGLEGERKTHDVAGLWDGVELLRVTRRYLDSLEVSGNLISIGCGKRSLAATYSRAPKYGVFGSRSPLTKMRSASTFVAV